MQSPLKDKWILITGASSGFGAAAAQSFAKAGSKLLLGARRVQRLKQVASDATSAGAPEAHFHFLDVSKTSSVEDFMAWARQQIAKTSPKASLDVLINNAGGALGLDTVAQGK